MVDMWKVLLIGGSSATGKSYLARQLSEYYKVPLTEVDDIRIALQQLVNKTEHPDLYFFLDNRNFLQDYSTEVLVENLLAVGQEVWPALDTLITKHLVCNEPVIFEGDSILPNLLAQRELSQIRAIFLYDSTENLKEREIRRNRAGQSDSETLDQQINFSSAYGEKLKAQAEQYGFIAIKASPLETLFERAKEALEK